MMIVQDFEEYQKSRAVFVQTVAELAARPQNIRDLIAQSIFLSFIIDVLEELEELLDDPVPSIKLSATLALARIMSYSESLSKKAKKRGLTKVFVGLLTEPGSYEKKVGAFALRAMAKHSTELAQAVFEAKGMEKLHSCLNNDDSSVKEMAASALAQLAKYTIEQAQMLNSNGITQQLLECITKEQEEALKKEALVALTEIAKHDERLGDSILDKGGSINLIRLLSSPNIYIRRQACACLAQIAKHGPVSAGRIADEALGKLMEGLKDLDPYVKRNSMTCIREIIKHEGEQANKLNKLGGPGPIVKYITETSGNMRLPGIIVLRHYAMAESSNAKAIIECNGILPLKEALVSDPLIFVQSAAAWTLGEIAKYSVEHAAPIVEAEVHETLRGTSKRIEAERRSDKFRQTATMSKTGAMSVTKKRAEIGEDQKEETQSVNESRKEEERKAEMQAKEDLRRRVFEALGKIIENCKKHDTMIDIFLEEVHDIKNESTQQLLKITLQRLSILIRERGNCWKKFAVSGALKKLQEIRMSEDIEVKHIVNTFFHSQIDTINSQYKDELIGLFKKKEEILKRLEAEIPANN